MNRVKLNGTDITVSKTALGTATFGKEIDQVTSFMLMDSFFENGGNLLDTANAYADWLPGEKSSSEKTIGKWMNERNNRHDIIISTKGGHPPCDNMDLSRLSKADILSDIESSLKNLQTDYIDVYFLHRDDTSMHVGEIMSTLNEIIKSGKARSIGLSNWCPERIEDAMRYCEEHGMAQITSSQIHFGIAHPNADKLNHSTEFMHKEAFEFYAKQDLALFSFSSQSGGYFFICDENGEPKANPLYDNAKSREQFYKVKDMCKKYDCSVGALIVSALSSNPYFNTIPIIGCMTKEQIDDSMAGLTIKMSDEDIKSLILRD